MSPVKRHRAPAQQAQHGSGVRPALKGFEGLDPQLSQWPKRCGCGALYDERQWLRLPLVGVMNPGDDDALELRHCSCSSTIAMPLEVVAAIR